VGRAEYLIAPRASPPRSAFTNYDPPLTHNAASRALSIDAPDAGTKPAVSFALKGTGTVLVQRASVAVRLVWMVGLTNFFAGCDGGRTSSGEEANDDVRVAAAAVVGGQTTDPCDWPSTVDVNGCTGTLIHPRVVTTAAHCLNFTNQVKFTAGNGIAGSFSVDAQCNGGAFGSFGGGTSNDWAYCILPDDDRVAKFPITPPLVGCEADKFLKPGGSAWVVGFGSTGSNLNDYGVKRAVEVKINDVSNGIVDVGDKDVGACHGDSGGPLYVRVGDATHDWGWRVAGSTSGAGNSSCDCTCDTIYVDIKNHVRAIEQNENIDVTPCTDDNGAWAPTPRCSGFISDPQRGTGTYPNCSVPMTTGPIETCGKGVMPSGSGGTSGAGGSGGSGAGGSAAAGSGGESATGTGGVMSTGTGGMVNMGTGGVMSTGTGGMFSMGTGGVMSTGTGGANAGAGGAPAQPAVDNSALPNGTAGVSGGAGQGYIPAGTGGVPAAGVAGSVPQADATATHASAGCRIASDPRSGARGLYPVFALLAWQLRRARRGRRRADLPG
jgi:hypothetical protein